MSNPHRPFGVPPDDDDLERESRADAPADADALDAWLNEIAHDGGLPGPRSGIGQYRPDARIDDHDVTDADSLIETAARFHRRIEAAHGARPRAASPDPQLWETIMERTSTPAAAVTAGTPWAARQTTRIPAPAGTPGTRHREIQRRAWNMAATIGLAAAILLALLGTWRLAGEPGMPGGGDGSNPLSHMAMQPATPGGTPTTEPPSSEAAAQRATPTQTTTCDLGRDIPIVNGADATPWPGTAVLLTTSGQVVLACPEAPGGDVLATTSGRASVSPLDWPGVVMVHDTVDDPAASRTRVVSLVTGDIVEFGIVQSDVQASGPQQAPGSPWLVGPAPNDVSDVQILDLRTMQTRLLSEIAGTALPNHGGYLLSTSSDGSTLVIALLKSAHPTEGNATLVTQGLPGDLLALEGSLDAATWISAQADFPAIVGFAVSPDGQQIALHGASGSMQQREHVWSVARLGDGTELARSATVVTGPEPTEGAWTDRGFAYIDGSALMLLSGDATAEPVLRGNGPLTDLRRTSDPSVVLVDQEWGDDPATMVANTQEPTTYSVNVGTGDATTITGVDVSANTRPWPYPTRFLVTFNYQLEPRDAITYRVVDAVTGETVGTLDDVPLKESGYAGYPMLGPRSVVSSSDGETEVIAFDTQHIYAMSVVGGEPTAQHIASPPGLPSEYPLVASMFLSSDGSLLSLSADGDEARTRWLLPIDGEPGDWVGVENQSVSDDPGYIFFVPGSGD